jgi:hypothetical protein
VRVARVAVLLVLTLSSTACLVVSLQPVYEPETIAFEPSLVGTWASHEDGVTLTVERAEWHSYHLALADDEKITRLSARLTRVGDLQLLDITPLDGTDIEPFQLPVHGIFRVTIEDDTLTVANLDYDHFYAIASRGESGLAIDGRKNVVLTMPTADLRHWLQEHAGEAGLFSAPSVLKRKVE